MTRFPARPILLLGALGAAVPTAARAEPKAADLVKLELVADTPDGLLLSTNQSWSIDDRRVNFQFGVEAAWEIRGGRLGRLYRNATYDGKTTEFWSSLDAVCGPQDWVVWGVPNCGKGQPFQNARVGHGAAPARFHNVHVGVRR